MPVKYHCQKCGKKFVDWGAEKLSFKCPDCVDEELVRVSTSEDKPRRRPSLKRKAKRKAVKAPAVKEKVVPVVEEVNKQGPQQGGKASVEQKTSRAKAERDATDDEAEDDGEDADEADEMDGPKELDFDKDSAPPLKKKAPKSRGSKINRRPRGPRADV